MKSNFRKFIKKMFDKYEINFTLNSNSVMGLSPKNQLRKYLENFRPIDNGVPLIRIGEEGDGGYLLPDDLEGIEACCSPGSDMLWTFESELALKYGIKSFICDREESRPSNLTKFQNFTAGWLANESSDGYISLRDWISQSDLSVSSDFILQMDIEDAEWPVLLGLDLKTLLRFRVIVVEFHFLSQLRNRLAFEKLFKPGLDKLFENFDVVHAHPNNCCGTFTIAGVEFPELVEITFHRKDRARFRSGFRPIPHKLDSKCVAAKDELTFPWL